MWVITHALSGLTLGALAPIGTALVVLSALVLHVLLDLVPHWDYTGMKRNGLLALMDVALAVAAVAILALTLHLSTLAVVAAVVSAAPDLDVLDAVLPGRPRRRLFPSHWKTFPHGSARPPFGIPVQVVVMAVSIVLAVLWG